MLAAVIGAVAALLVAMINAAAFSLHALLFNLQVGERLSGLSHLPPMAFVWPVAGGAVLCALNWFCQAQGCKDVVDPIEANALHGGRMSVRDSALLTLQTLVSNGFGASVGLEAGYTQIGSGLASKAGRWLRLRREDMRIIVGCGAAGAIAAAFNGPLTGAFYAFELVLAQYAIGYVAPIMAASIAATLSMHALGGAPFTISISAERAVAASDFPLFIVFGGLCAGAAIIWMRALPFSERMMALTKAPKITHPILGGLVLGGIVLINPHVLSGGHGALELSLFSELSLAAALSLAAFKMLASAVSLGSGFRGGLFFSSLLVGALLGRALALGIAALWPQAAPDATAFSLVGMGALAAAVIGTPLTMSFLVLETTSDYGLTGAVLAAAITSNLFARELFGYSFSTWRFHLRGETVRSARDIGWVRKLTVERLMRTDPATAPIGLSIGEFQLQFPLGSRQRVALTDDQGRFHGIVTVAEAHTEGLQDSTPVRSLARHSETALLPRMSIKDAMRLFDETESDTLAVINNVEDRRFLGTLKESYATRRYAEEMEKAHQLGL